MRRRRYRFFCTSPWDTYHRLYGTPVAFSIHTEHWYFSVRPFSSYAQGGDRRDEDWHRERTAKWLLMKQRPGIWETVNGRRR